MALFFLVLWLVVLPLAGLALAAYLIFRWVRPRGRRPVPGAGPEPREPPLPEAGPFAPPGPAGGEEARVAWPPAAEGVEAAEEIGAPQDAALPAAYGEDRLVLLVRDPYWLFSYWELGPSLEAEAARLLGAEYAGSRPVLRLYDLDQGDHTDSRLVARASNWYLNPGRPGHRFLAELGRLAPSGRFLPLLRSNLVAAPPDRPAPGEDGEWACPEELLWRLYPWLRRGPGSPLYWGRRRGAWPEAGFSPGAIWQGRS